MEKELYMCFVDLEKVLDSVPMRVIEWKLRRKGVLEALVRAVINLYKGARTRVRLDSALSEDFEVKVGVQQGSVLSPLLFVIVVAVVTESAGDGVLTEN